MTSAYPPQVDELVPAARELAAELGTLPSKKQLRDRFRIGHGKATALLEAVSLPVAADDQPAPSPLVATRTETGPEPSRLAAEPVSRLALVGTFAAVALVALVALVASFSHMHDLAEAAGEDWRAPLFPLSVDGLVLAAGFVMWSRSRAGRETGFLALFSLVLGVAVSVLANVATTDAAAVLAYPGVRAVIAGWAPVAAFLAVHLLMSLARDGKAAHATLTPASSAGR